MKTPWFNHSFIKWQYVKYTNQSDSVNMFSTTCIWVHPASTCRRFLCLFAPSKVWAASQRPLTEGYYHWGRSEMLQVVAEPIALVINSSRHVWLITKLLQKLGEQLQSQSGTSELEWQEADNIIWTPGGSLTPSHLTSPKPDVVTVRGLKAGDHVWEHRRQLA